MKPGKIILINVSLLLLVVLLFFAITSTNFLSSGRRDSEVVLVMKTTERISEFWLILEKGAVQAADDLGINLRVTGPDQEDNIQQQIEIMDEVIALEPDAVILAATDYTRLVPSAAKVRENKIAFLTVDSFIESDHSQCEIGTDNVNAGQKLGNHMAGQLKAGDSLALISFVQDSSPAIERELGFRDAIPNTITILDTVYTNNSIPLGYNETRRLLDEYPELDAVAALNENSAVGAYQAIKERERAGEIIFMTFDSDAELIRGLEEGVIAATLVQKPYNMGYLAVKNAAELIQGKKVSKQIDTGSELITLDNMYDIKNQKLLFPSH